MAANLSQAKDQSNGLQDRLEAIRRRAAANPDGRLASFLQALDPPNRITSGGIQGGPSSETPPNGQPAFDGFLLQWTSSVTEEERSGVRSRTGYRLREAIELRGNSRDQPGDHVEVVEFPEGEPPELIAQTLARQPGVRWIEPNWRLQKLATTNDPSLLNGNLWGMYGSSSTPANSYGSHAINAWARGAVGEPSSRVYVGVIDEGLQWNHPDLSGQVGNPLESNNGLDDDGNGYVDDINGWDFVNNDFSVYDGSALSPSLDAHGTHVAGTIAAKADGSGVVGVAWNAGLISGKFLGATGGTTANAIAAINYFVDLKQQRKVDIVALNNSWGGGGFSQSLQTAIEAANAAGILFVAAAGNSGSTTVSYPAGYPNSNVISVASITSSGARSSFSNYGSSWVDIGAPGSVILSSVPVNSFANYDGTSMATPHVTGAIAALAAWGKSKNLFSSDLERRDRIRDAILQSATPTASLSGATSTGGRLNLDAALLLLDPSLKRFQVSGTPNPVSEGASLSLTISEASNQAPISSELFWKLSGNGITTTDVVGGVLSGSLPIGSTNLQLTFSNDVQTEGQETARFELFSDTGMTVSEGFLSIAINDTSQAPITPKIWGTTSNNILTGTTASEWLTGVTATGTSTANLGRLQIDTVTGLAGNDTFLLGDSRGIFYNDGNTGSTGSGDYLLIKDFQQGIDKIGIRSGSNYLSRSATISGITYTEIYWDQLANGILNTSGTSRDELVARLQGTYNLNPATDFVAIA